MGEPPQRGSFANRWACALILAPLLAACATNDDPGAGGFVNGVVGLASGAYRARIHEREQIYRAEIASRHRLEREAEGMRRERSTVRVEFAHAELRLAGVERAVGVQRGLLHQARAANRTPRRISSRLDAAEGRALPANGDLAEARRGPRSTQEVAGESNGLRAELEELDQIVSVLGAEKR